jgi:hypothetical protein
MENNTTPLAGGRRTMAEKLAAITALLKDEHGAWRDDVSGADFVQDVTTILDDAPMTMEHNPTRHAINEDDEDDAGRVDLDGLDFDEIAEQQGWNAQTLVDILREYISNQHCDDALDDFAREKANEENA